MKVRFGSLFSFLCGFLFREISEKAAPISKEAAKPDHGEGWVTAKESTKFKNTKEYPPTTVIIGGENLDGGCAQWDFEIPKYVRERLIDITLRIDTIRTHGTLHTPKGNKDKSAKILVNGKVLDHIDLVKELPNGEDLGVDSRRPVSVISYIDKENRTQTIKLCVDKGVLWDVDWVTLEPLIERKEIRTEAAMIIGALISALIGALVGLYL